MPNRTFCHIPPPYLMIALSNFIAVGVLCSCSEAKKVVVIDVRPVMQELEKVDPTDAEPSLKVENEESLSAADELAKTAIKKIVETTIVEPQSDLILSSSAAAKPENGKKAIFLKVSMDGTVFKVREGQDDVRLGVFCEMEPEAKAAVLKEALKGGDVENGKPIVKVAAGANVKADKVIDLLNLLVEQGVTKLTFDENSKNQKEPNPVSKK